MWFLLSLLSVAAPHPTGTAIGLPPTLPAHPAASGVPSAPGHPAVSEVVTGFSSLPLDPTQRDHRWLNADDGWRVALVGDPMNAWHTGAPTIELIAILRRGEVVPTSELSDRNGRAIGIVPLRFDRVQGPSGSACQHPTSGPGGLRASTQPRPGGAIMHGWASPPPPPSSPQSRPVAVDSVRARLETADGLVVRVGPRGTDWSDPTAGMLLTHYSRPVGFADVPLELAVQAADLASRTARASVVFDWGQADACAGEEFIDLDLSFDSTMATLTVSKDPVLEGLEDTVYEDEPSTLNLTGALPASAVWGDAGDNLELISTTAYVARGDSPDTPGIVVIPVTIRLNVDSGSLPGGFNLQFVARGMEGYGRVACLETDIEFPEAVRDDVNTTTDELEIAFESRLSEGEAATFQNCAGVLRFVEPPPPSVVQTYTITATAR